MKSILTDIHNTNAPDGLNMHLRKTKMMFNDHVTESVITVVNNNIEEVDSCVYLGKKISQRGTYSQKLSDAFRWDGLPSAREITS